MEKKSILQENELFQKFTKTKFYNALMKFLKRGNVRFVLFLYFISILLFGYTLMTNMFTIPLGGDFVLQEIPFYYNGYDDYWSAITKGEFVFWDENTNLGVNNIGANSFYYLLDIFFLPTLLVPRAIVPQTQAFLMITKMVLAGYVMKRLLNDQFKVSEGTSKMVSVAYAFCGWTLYYLWFNHFIEITILLPLVLYGVEDVLRKEKPTALILSLFLSAMTNYFFFIMICFCTVIYAVFRYFQMFSTYTNKQKGRVILLGIGAYVIGMVMSLLILLPAFKVALESSRAAKSSYSTALVNSLNAIMTCIRNRDFSLLFDNINGFFKNLFYFSNPGSTTNVSNITRVYLYPLMTFFYPTVSCNSHLLINNNGYDNALSSLFVYSPIMLMLIPSILTSVREKKVSHVVGVIGMLILIFTPFAYYCFSGFTNICYGRWELFPVVCIFIYVAINFDHREKIKPVYLDISIGICIAMELLLINLGDKLQGTTAVNNMDPDAKNVCYAQLIYIFVLYLYIKAKFADKKLTHNLKWVIGIEAMVSFNLLLGFTLSAGDNDLYVGFFGTTSYENLYGGLDSVKTETELVKQIKKQDKEFYRIYNTSFDRSSNNLGMVESYNGLGTFHSIYGYEIDDFASWTHFKYNGSWSMGEHEKKINMDNFLNVKYYIANDSDTNIPFGYKEIMRKNNKVVYENEYYLPMGFSFTNIVNADSLNTKMGYTNNFEYYLGSTYTGYLPRAEYLLTSKAIMYEKDAEEIIEDYPEFSYQSNADLSNDLTLKNNVVVRNIRDNEVLVRQAQWNDGPGGDGSFKNEWIDVTPYSRKAATGLKWNSELIAILTSPLAPDVEKRGGKAYITITARMGENLIITLYDKDDKEITSDRHMKHNYDKSSDKKFERGFYVDRPVYKIKVTVKDTFKTSATLCKPNATYEYFDTYQTQMNKLKKYQFTNVKKSNNRYQFDSSLDQNMVSVLTIPYDEGWTLYRTDSNNHTEEVKIYKGQGGFVSFVNLKGDYHYKMVYHTPLLSQGCVCFAIGSMMFFGIYYLLDIRRKDKEFLDQLISLRK